MSDEPHLEQIPGAAHYSATYLKYGRVFSYAHQLDQILRVGAGRVVEVGPGGGIVTNVMRAVGIEVVTVDVQRELKPDVVASVTELPFEDRSFDLAMCCQVLEHLPFDQFERSVSELWRVSDRALILSLPDARAYFEARLRLPRILNWRWTGHMNRKLSETYKKKKFDEDGHYWEIGYPDYPYRRVRDAIANITGQPVHSWSVSENHYHRFFKVVRGEVK